MTAFNPTSHMLPVALFWLSFIAWAAFWVIIGMRKSPTLPSADHHDGRLLIALSLWGGVILAVVVAWAFPDGRVPGNGWTSLAVGLVGLWGGIGLRIWAIQTLGHYFRTIVIIQKDHRLIQAGPYRLLRHPSYAGTVLTTVGVGIALGNWLSILLGAGGALIGFLRRISVEEAALQEHLGASYTSYMRHTWRLVPFVW